MYDFIRGKLAERNPAYAVLETGGVGYMLHISVYTYSRIEENSECRLFTHLVVKEDDLQLFGFYDREERELFRQLISVSGVGVSTARIILSSLPPAELIQAIAEGNAPLLQKIKGIGAKTAQRIIIDLKEKVAKVAVSKDKIGAGHNTGKEEALSGLIILGFPRMLAEKALNKIIETDGKGLSVEELIRHALKIL